jgi:hypothetical protein
MSKDNPDSPQILGLNTKVEEDFVMPLTAIKGALELLRDFPDLESDKRQRFVASALHECARLEDGIEQLAESVYEAGRRALESENGAVAKFVPNEHAHRIQILEDLETVEIDFADLHFTDSETVNAVYDAIEMTVSLTDRRWYFIVNHAGCRVWPEAWVAFAHRGKKINFMYSLGTVQFETGRVIAENQKFRRNSAGVEVLEAATREDALALIADFQSQR